jgi:HemY protein
MLLYLIKIFGFFIIVAAIAIGVGELFQSSGFIRLSMFDFEFTMSPLIVLLVFTVIFFVFWILLKLFGLINAIFSFVSGDETAVSRFFYKNRERKGFEALADGMVALASGESKLAVTKAARAEKYLKRPELTNLITAQAAEALNDKPKAYEFYKKLLKDDRTRFVGVIGIMKQKLSEGDTDLALKLAERAFSLKPKHEKTQDFLLNLQAKKEDWSGARRTLSAKLKYGTLPRDVHRRRDAVLALSEAKSILAEGKNIEAREAAIEANRLSPDLIPAATMAARSYMEGGKVKNALRVLKKAWEVRPHPDLATVFLEVTEKEDHTYRIKSFKALSRVQANHNETKLFLAELYVSSEDFDAARLIISDIVQTVPTARLFTIRAAISKGEGEDDEFVRGLLNEALKASRGSQWVCENCSQVHVHWASVCANCSSLDTLSWQEMPIENNFKLPASVDLFLESDDFDEGDINITTPPNMK